jgi:hypothetical protein
MRQLRLSKAFTLIGGDWNYSYAALRKSRECVIAVPTIDMLDTVVKAPLIKECLANIECKVIDVVTKHNIVVLEGVAAHIADDTDKHD